MKTWRDRITEAEARGRSWRRWLPFHRSPRGHWPFTDEDGERATSTFTCAASEVSQAVGLSTESAIQLWYIGNDLQRHVIHGRSREAARCLDRIEDLALQIKRGTAR